MAVKEFREFFLRTNQVVTGNKKDQQVNYPINSLIGSIRKGNRFLKGHFPTEDVFKKLFESIAFKKNVEDTADSTNQGLVRLATDTEAKNRTIKLAGTFTTVTSPEQLPEVVVNNTISAPYTSISSSSANGITITKLDKDLGNGRIRRDFDVKLESNNTPIEATSSVLVASYESGNHVRKYVAYTEIGTLLPSGSIIMWPNGTPPTGWRLCNGANGTPDLADLRIGSTYFISKI